VPNACALPPLPSIAAPIATPPNASLALSWKSTTLCQKQRGGTSTDQNLTLACPLCNSHKSDRTHAVDPETGALSPLFHPNGQVWHEHFGWTNKGAVVVGKTPVGRATVAALDMNHPDIVATRRLWIAVGWHPPADDLYDAGG
jgi:hypothetical protein